MRVAHVGNVGSCKPNGVIQVTTSLAQRLPGLGIETEVWHLSRSQEKVEHRIVEGVSVWDLPSIGPSGRSGAHLQIPAPKTLAWLKRRSRQVDLVHLHSVFQPDHVWTSHFGTPFILTPHGGYHPYVMREGAIRAKRLWFRLHDRSRLRHASRVQVLSERELSDVKKLCPKANAVVLPTPLDFASAPGASTYDPAGPILFLGRLSIKEKGLDLLLDGFARSLALTGSNLLLIGPSLDGADEVLRARAADLGISERVQVLPPVHGVDKHRVIQSAGLFALTSRREGLPLGPLEAMSAGIPVLITPDTNLDPLVSASSAGWVVHPTPEAVGEGLVAFRNASDEERREAGRRGQAQIHTIYDWNELGPRYRDFYESAAR